MKDSISPKVEQELEKREQNISTNNLHKEGDLTWFMWRALAVVVLTPIIFFAKLILPDFCYANCRIVSYSLHPKSNIEAFLWFIFSLSLAIYFMFYKKSN